MKFYWTPEVKWISYWLIPSILLAYVTNYFKTFPTILLVYVKWQPNCFCFLVTYNILCTCFERFFLLPGEWKWTDLKKKLVFRRDETVRTKRRGPKLKKKFLHSKVVIFLVFICLEILPQQRWSENNGCRWHSKERRESH